LLQFPGISAFPPPQAGENRLYFAVMQKFEYSIDRRNLRHSQGILLAGKGAVNDENDCNQSLEIINHKVKMREIFQDFSS
jgi:hypothetical protein